MAFTMHSKAVSKTCDDENCIDTTSVNTNFCFNPNDIVITEAEKYLGIKYKYGGITDKGFDCSGFTSHVFSSIALALPHSAAEQSTMGIPVNMNQCQKGDLIFFKGRSAKLNKVGHVGIVVENNDSVVKFIHASLHSGITISNLNDPYYQKRYVCIRKIINDTLQLSYSESNLSAAQMQGTIMKETSKTEITQTIENSSTTTSTIHIVKKGETLYHIASIYGVAINDLKKWNNLKSNLIMPRQELIVRKI